jgi:anhydro-N-acetylmuramic acid kinase
VDLFIGLMSGTSIDAVDGVVVGFDASGNLQQTLATASLPMPAALRTVLGELQSLGPDELSAAALAANQLADLYAECVRKLLDQSSIEPSSVTALGAHGQTVRHDPQRGYTIQLMNGARLAEATGIDSVTDLRSADIAAGGQGAPLVPAFHARVFGHTAAARAIVNIGGIANITLLRPSSLSAPLRPSGRPGPGGSQGSAGPTEPAAGSAGMDPGATKLQPSPTVIGYDTGPGNTLMDSWCEQHLRERFDRDGNWAATGRVDSGLLQRMRAEPYFSRPAPKSTGRDLFNPQWLQRQDLTDLAAADVQASLLELTASTIADNCRLHGVAEVFVCGGGAANGRLMGRLQAALPGVQVSTTSALGLHPQAVEATAFAWLARQRVLSDPASLPSVTGAAGPRVLGALYVSGTRKR